MQVKGTLEGFPLMLVGNKCDDDAKREVNKKTGEALQVCENSIIQPCSWCLINPISLGKLLSLKFGIQKLTKGKFLNYFLGIIFGNFSGNKNFISRKENIFMK